MSSLGQKIKNYIERRLNSKYNEEDNSILYKTEPHYNIHDFTDGLIVKMRPGYYTKNSYYVGIKDVSFTSITTYIPNHHDLIIEVDSGTWNYQVNRMKIIGHIMQYGHLLYNQKLD
jgi:hypothetical protein